MGLALPLASMFVTHNSRPLRESNARKRLSSVEAINSTPPAVAIGPARTGRPVFCMPAGSCSVTPTGTRQAKSPVAAFTATSVPHGGFWHGQFVLPTATSNVPRPGVAFSYGTVAPSRAFRTNPSAPTSCVATNT